MPLRSRNRGLVALALVLAAAGCAHGPGTSMLTDSVHAPDCDGPPRHIPPAVRAGLPTRDVGTYGTDLEWIELAERVPGGFGGAFGARRYGVLWLTDPGQARAAKAALAPYLDPMGFRTARARVRQARWTFADLADWGAVIRQRGLRGVARDDIITTDRDGGVNRLTYGVRDRAARDRVVAALGTLDLPCDLTIVGVTAPIVPLGR